MLKKNESFVLETNGNIVVGRENGKKLLGQLIGVIENTAPSSVIPIDFKKIKFIDFSSADEFIGKLIGRLCSTEFKDIHVYLVNLTSEIEETVDAVLKLRGQNAIEVCGGKAKILGKLNPVLKETFDYIVSEKEVSARKLADKTKLAINASSNRLTTLHRLGLIARLATDSGKGAEQFTYHAIC